MACLVAMLLGSREFLKRGFLPLLLLFIVAWIVFVMGIFDQAITLYTMRATEETGRFLVWPRAFEHFINSPLTGVGVSNAPIYIAEKGKSITPHNGFLFIAMTAGIIPLMFYIAYWVQAIWAALSVPAGRTQGGSLHLSLVVYAFLIVLASNMGFMAPWVIVTVTTAIASRTPYRQVSSRAYCRKKVEKLVPPRVQIFGMPNPRTYTIS